jgi:5-methylcytosine-specific restriction endonuclease McrA
MTLEEGLAYLRSPSQQRKIMNNWVENKAKRAATRLHMFASGQTTCVACGLKGEVFHIERHENDKVMPFSINLYGIRDGKEVMMTWDHILPKSLGGSNHLDNAQCMCFTCNSSKKNVLTLRELVDIASGSFERFQSHPHLAGTIFNTIKAAKDKKLNSSRAKSWSWNWDTVTRTKAK